MNEEQWLNDFARARKTDNDTWQCAILPVAIVILLALRIHFFY